MGARFVWDCALTLLGLLDVRPTFRRSGGGPTVLLQAYSVHLAQFYVPVVRSLRRQLPDVEISLALLPHPHFGRGTFERLRTFALTDLGLDRDAVIPHWRALREPFDLSLHADAYARLYPRASRACLLTHGPGLGRRFFERGRLRKTVSDFDLVLVSGPYDQTLVEEHVRRVGADTSTAAVGLPLFDGIPSGPAARAEYSKRFDLDPEKPLVLVAPHWAHLAQVTDPESSFLEETLSACDPLDANVVVKLHACSTIPAMAGRVDWPSYLAGRVAGSEVRVDHGIDDRPALACCDVLVTDTSSRAFVAMWLETPVVLYGPSGAGPDRWSRERTALLESGAWRAETAEALHALLAMALSERAPHPGAGDVVGQCFATGGGAEMCAARLISGGLMIPEEPGTPATRPKTAPSRTGAGVMDS